MKKLIKNLLPSSIKNFLKKYIRIIRATNKNNKIVEHMELDFILSRLHSQKKVKILEIGSHKGEIFNIISGNNFGHKFHIICIEPNPASFRELKKNYSSKIKKIAKVYFHNFGISSEDKVLSFYSPSSSSALFTMQKENLDKFKLQDETINRVDIQTYRIETLLFEKKFIENFYDIIKIDAEGYDYEITLQILENNILFNNLMVEIDIFKFNFLSKIITSLKKHTAYVFLRDGINTLTIEKFNNVKKLKELVFHYQDYADNPIAGNIVFVKNNK